ncbi:MAG: TorF family putative porin [Geminicoccaceae bacterium]
MPLHRSTPAALALLALATVLAFDTAPAVAEDGSEDAVADEVPGDDVLDDDADEDGDGESVWLYGEIGLVSDYVDRGISNSDERPALQAGLTYEFDLRLEHEAIAYLDLWGSNVDFDDGGEARVEVDLSFGLAAPLGESGFDVDVAATYIAYPGADGDLDYNYVEFPMALGYTVTDDLYLGLGYSFAPDYSGSVGRAHYVEATASWSLPWLQDSWPLALDARLGRQWFQSNSMAGLDDYFDWGLGVTLTLGRFDLGLHYTDTNLGRNDCYGGSDACAARLVLSAVARF